MKAYYIKNCYDGESMICVIAETPNKAKMIAHKYFSQYDGGEYIDLRATVGKNLNIKGLKENAIIPDMEGLKRGIYGCLFEQDCPICKSKGINLYYDNGFYCDECEEKNNMDGDN